MTRRVVIAVGEERGGIKAARVLVADDSRDNRQAMGLWLSVAGAEVDLAADGLTAVEMACAARDAGRPFDLVLMDLQMPGLDGFEATRRLRDEGFRTPVIALSAHAMPEDRLDCLRSGCDDHVSKPVDWAVLFALMSRLLEGMER
jgi:CheY-like chemotaxis protein